MSSKTASNGPRNAPALSPTPSSPKALPLFASSTEEAMSAGQSERRCRDGPGIVHPGLSAERTLYLSSLGSTRQSTSARSALPGDRGATPFSSY